MNTLELSRLKQYLLQEIGDTSNIETYPTTWENPRNTDELKHYTVRFSTGTEKDDNKYVVYFSVDKRDIKTDDIGPAWFMSVEFGVEGDSKSYDYVSVVNNDKMYKVMATVIQIVKELISEFDNMGHYVREIWIDPSRNFEGDTRRSRLYKAYIQKNMPEGSDLEIPDDMSYIKLTLPKKK